MVFLLDRGSWVVSDLSSENVRNCENVCVSIKSIQHPQPKTKTENQNQHNHLSADNNDENDWTVHCSRLRY
jgi:hypothetical protein